MDAILQNSARGICFLERATPVAQAFGSRSGFIRGRGNRGGITRRMSHLVYPARDGGDRTRCGSGGRDKPGGEQPVSARCLRACGFYATISYFHFTALILATPSPSTFYSLHANNNFPRVSSRRLASQVDVSSTLDMTCKTSRVSIRFTTCGLRLRKAHRGE